MIAVKFVNVNLKMPYKILKLRHFQSGKGLEIELPVDCTFLHVSCFNLENTSANISFNANFFQNNG